MRNLTALSFILCLASVFSFCTEKKEQPQNLDDADRVINAMINEYGPFIEIDTTKGGLIVIMYIITNQDSIGLFSKPIKNMVDKTLDLLPRKEGDGLSSSQQFEWETPSLKIIMVNDYRQSEQNELIERIRFWIEKK